MIKHTTGFYSTGKDSAHKAQRFYRSYEPENPRAAILILHGMKDHSGRYVNFAEYLAGKGIAVLTYDHLGHGKTAGDAEKLGYFQSEDPAAQLIDDAAAMANFLRLRHRNIPLFVAGHSMGSFIARLLLEKQSELFAGAVFIGTGAASSDARMGKYLTSLLNLIAPRRRSKLVNNIFLAANNRRFKKEKDFDGTNWISLDTDNRKAYNADEYCNKDFSNNGFDTLLEINLAATRKNWFAGIPHAFPMLFISGVEDPIGNFGEGIKTIVQDLEEKNYTDVQFQLMDEMRHEILNEAARQKVYDVILQWLESRIVA